MERLSNVSKVGTRVEPRHGREKLEKTLVKGRPPIPLFIRCFGKFEVSLGNNKIEDGQWNSKKAKAIFWFLVYQRGHPIHKDLLMESIWPDYDIDMVQARFYKAMSRLYRILEPDHSSRHSSNYIRCHQGAYYLDFEQVALLDVDEFLKKIKSGEVEEKRGNHQEAFKYYLEAERLYRGDFLEENIYEGWAVTERERLRNTYGRLATKLARLFYEQGSFGESMEYCWKRIKSEKYCCEAYLLLMQNYCGLGETHEAMRIYRMYSEMLKKELGESPSLTLARYYQEISSKG